MSIASLYSRAVLGMNAPLVTVEVHASNGLPSFSIVGLPEASVKESKERVRSALISSGFKIPPKRITVNLAPADLPKTGGRYDLPIALGVLFATEQFSVDSLAEYEYFGELALTGELRGIKGAIPSFIAACKAGKRVLFSQDNLDEASLVLETYPEFSGRLVAVKDLRQACHALIEGGQAVQTPKSSDVNDELYLMDLADVHGQYQAKRALEIAACGHHSMMMVGPPGAGKSMLASRLVSILPSLNSTEALEVASLRSLAGDEVDRSCFYKRPFLHPHHTASAPALVGGGSNPKPGALSLAHHGVLFLDELPEFNRNVLEALREPLETKMVNISRVNQQVSYPANSLLITAMNPSPSGYFPDDSLGRCCKTQNYLIITKLTDNLHDYLRIAVWLSFIRYLMLFSLLNQGRLNG